MRVCVCVEKKDRNVVKIPKSTFLSTLLSLFLKSDTCRQITRASLALYYMSYESRLAICTLDQVFTKASSAGRHKDRLVNNGGGDQITEVRMTHC